MFLKHNGFKEQKRIIPEVTKYLGIFTFALAKNHIFIKQKKLVSEKILKAGYHKIRNLKTKIMYSN